MNTKKTIKEFFLENILSWIFVAFFLMLVYGIKVFNISISHDTEAIIAVPEALYDSWIILGRFGLVLVKKILGIMSFNPYIATFMMVVLMMINAIAWEYLFCSLTGMWYMKYKWILPVVFFTSKIYVEQNAFILQTYEVNLVLLLVCFSLYAFFFVGSKWKYITMIMINAWRSLFINHLLQYTYQLRVVASYYGFIKEIMKMEYNILMIKLYGKNWEVL